jgi:hypothetical protein
MGLGFIHVRHSDGLAVAADSPAGTLAGKSKSEYRRNAGEGAAGLSNPKQIRMTELRMIKIQNPVLVISSLSVIRALFRI